MSAGCRPAAGLAVAVVVALAMSCAARRQASDLHDDQTTGMEPGNVPTQEERIREDDMMRLEEFEELQREMDEQIGTLEEEDAQALEARPPGFGERAKRALEKAGLVTYTVIAVAFSLGMAALPFLIF